MDRGVRLPSPTPDSTPYQHRIALGSMQGGVRRSTEEAQFSKRRIVNIKALTEAHFVRMDRLALSTRAVCD